MNRRAFISMLAALPVIALRPAAAGVETATPPSPRYPSFGIPRGVVVEMPPTFHTGALIDPGHTHSWSTSHQHSFTPGVYATPARMNVQMISNGVGLVPLESEEGQRILIERAVNLRSDGSIRHRQHHPVDFPPRR